MDLKSNLKTISFSIPSRQKHQKGTLLQIIYQKGALLQLFPERVCFFIAKRPPPRRLHYARDMWHREVAPLTQTPLVVARGQALLVAPLLQALRLAQDSQAPAPILFFSHPPVSSHTPPTPKFYIFYIVYQKFKFCFIFLISIICYFFIFPHPPPQNFNKIIFYTL